MAALVFERLRVNCTLMRYEGEWDSYIESENTFTGVMGGIYNGTYDAEVAPWSDIPIRCEHFLISHLSWEPAGGALLFAR